MTSDLLAEAGLSECARSESDCMPGFGLFLGGLAIAGIGVVLWITLATTATHGILSARSGTVGRTLWVVAVWGIPLVGAMAWFAFRRRPRSAAA
ncbi:hypothetical protein GCM10022140_50860 [Rhodococcus aetherivorans]